MFVQLIVEKTTDYPSKQFSLAEDAAQHFARLMDRLNEQRLFQPDLCDVDLVLVRQRSTFPAHKGVLAAHSPFFQALFTQGKQQQQRQSQQTQQREQRELRRVDLSLEALTSQGLTQILNFIYTSRLLVSGGTVQDVLNAATLLQMSDIAASCHELISSQALGLTVTTAETTSMATREGPAGLTAGSATQLYREIKQEAELGKLYGRDGGSPFSVRMEEGGGGGRVQHSAGAQVHHISPIVSTHPMTTQAHGSSPQVKHFFKKDDIGRGLCGLEAGLVPEGVGAPDGHASFNRDQIIVEVNLNNQTLNVSKGSEGKSTTDAAISVLLGRRHNNQPDLEEEKEGDDNNEDGTDMGRVEEDENQKDVLLANSSEDDNDDDNDEDEDYEEEENDSSIPADEIGMAGRLRRGTRTAAIAAATVSMRQRLNDAMLADRQKCRKSGKQEQESIGQKVL